MRLLPSHTCVCVTHRFLSSRYPRVDLSGHMINGDYSPNRLQAQYECVNLISTVKTQNPESGIGLMSLSCPPGGCPRVYMAPHSDIASPLLPLPHSTPGNQPQCVAYVEARSISDSLSLRWFCRSSTSSSTSCTPSTRGQGLPPTALYKSPWRPSS